MGYKDQITWAWHNPGPPSGPMGGECAAVVIAGKQRGNKTAHECVVECINVWVKTQNYSTALEWLTKGAQCHNKEAQKELNAAGTKAVQYAVETYGPLLNLGDLKLGGFDKPGNAGKEKSANAGKPSKASTAPKAGQAPVAPKPSKAPVASNAIKAPVAANTPKVAKAPIAAKPSKAPVAPKAAKAPVAAKASTGAKAPVTAKAPKKTK